MLFNKTGKGNEEMKDVLGFISKAITFKNFVSFISLAERDVYPIIGQFIVKIAQDHYNSENFEVIGQTDPGIILMDQLVHKIQLPLALHAYRRYVPSNDLSHSDVGRTINVTDNEKPAFEWQIERDNQNLLSLAFETTDLLLEFLNDNSAPVTGWRVGIPYKSGEFVSQPGTGYYFCVTDHTSGDFSDDLSSGKWKIVYALHSTPAAWVTANDYLIGAFTINDSKIYICNQSHTAGDFSDDLSSGKWSECYNGSRMLFEWTDSNAYSSSLRLLLPSADILEGFFSINKSSRLYYSLVPIIAQLQREVIEPCFTEEKFSEILLQIRVRCLNSQNAMLLDKARAALAMYVMSTAVERLNPQVFPEGIFNNYIALGGSARSAASISERTKLSGLLLDAGKTKLSDLQETLRKIACDESGEEFQVDDLLPKCDPQNDKFISLC